MIFFQSSTIERYFSRNLKVLLSLKQIFILKTSTKYSTILLGLFLISLFSCRKEDNFIVDSHFRLKFSNDTITFDTVFTTMGSVTQQLKVYNREKNPVQISRIFLAESNSSSYQINVDGRSGKSFTNIALNGGDSLYIFIRITIDPTKQNNPLIVRDSIIFEINGNRQDVDLYAWGQDAHFIMPNLTIQGLPPLNIIAKEGETLRFTKDKPYVIVGYAVVDSMANLIIDAGAKIHFYNRSGLWIYKGGNIQVNGSLEEPVIFQGTRLDADYKDLPAQWDRIWINESAHNSSFNYAIIKNGTIGIQAETLKESMGNTLFLKNTRIQNMSGWGLFTRFYQIEADNLLVANAGSSVLNLTSGGRYRFRNSTFGNYWSYGVRKDPLLHLSNFYVMPSAQGDIVYTGTLEDAYFGDCIFYGNLEEEILINPLSGTENQFNYLFDYCLIKSKKAGELNTNASIFNQEPLFSDPYSLDYQLDTLSPAINKGIFMGNPYDLNGRLRDEIPDLGAFEYYVRKTKTNRK